MLDIAGLDHIVIRAREPRVLIAFYRDVLGMTVERETAPEVGLTQLRAGRSLIDVVDAASELGRGGGPPPGPGPNVDHFCLRVRDFDAGPIRAHLAAHGIAAGEVAIRYGADGWGPSIYLADPEGNRLELKGPPEAEPASGG